jgi:hypothetical protein
MRLMTLCIAACLLVISPAGGVAGENCTSCHRVVLKGVHALLSCVSCHGEKPDVIPDPASGKHHAAGCIGCHQGYGALFDQPMTTRSREKLFVKRTLGREDPGFFEKNCASCHVKSCTDCHGGDGHNITRATDKSCMTCHRGYYVGMEYYGMAPREDSLRYQTGKTAFGEKYLKMTPDVHQEAGMRCGACHSMKSLAAGKKSSKNCVDCHKVRTNVIEHRIGAHMEKLECYACHSAWAAQEYGTFYLRFTNSPVQKEFEVVKNKGEYVKSSYLKKQDSPPLGVNAAGRVSPIRPEFILYATTVRGNKPSGKENQLLAAEWKAFFPHTIRRGTAMCDACHENARRFVMEKKEDRIYNLTADGMTLPSFWDREGQKVVNGDFLPRERYLKMSKKTPAYWRGYLEKWQKLLNRVGSSSSR